LTSKIEQVWFDVVLQQHKQWWNARQNDKQRENKWTLADNTGPAALRAVWSALVWAHMLRHRGKMHESGVPALPFPRSAYCKRFSSCSYRFPGWRIGAKDWGSERRAQLERHEVV